MTFHLDYKLNYQIPTLKAGIENIDTGSKKPVEKLVDGLAQDKSAGSAINQFGDMLEKNIEKVSAMDKQSDSLTQQYVSGADIPLHQVMVASEKASVAMNLTMQVRNKLMSAYQEIMRMPL